MRSAYKSSRVGAEPRVSIGEMACMCSSVGVIAGCGAVAAVVSDWAKLIITLGAERVAMGPTSSRVDPGSPVAIESEG